MQLDDLVHSAFAGAQFHLEKIKVLLNRPAMQTNWIDDSSLDEATKKTLAFEGNQLHWHIRAFFWELVATFDTLLQWENYRYDLGIQEEKVIWAEIKKNSNKAKKNHLDWDREYGLLEDAWNSDWFFEVTNYRNFAHRSFIFINAEYNGFYGKQKPKLITIFLTPARVGQQEYVDIFTCLTGYLKKMQELKERIFGRQTQ